MRLSLRYMRLKLIILCLVGFLLSLSGCYAVRMELDDPMGLPLADPQVQVQVDSQQVPVLAQQIETELLQLLPRERQVTASPDSGAWQLSAELTQRRQMLVMPNPLFSGIEPTARVHLELALEAILKGPSGEPRTWRFVKRGDARPDAETELTQMLLRQLRDDLLHAIQPEYNYR